MQELHVHVFRQNCKCNNSLVGQSSGKTHPSLYSTVPKGHTHPLLQASGQIKGGLSLFSQVIGHIVPQLLKTLPLTQATKKPIIHITKNPEMRYNVCVWMTNTVAKV